MIGYYITVKRDSRTGWLFGPIADRGVAEMMIQPVRALACIIDPFCDFDAFGVSSIERLDDRPLPPGKLNDQWHRT